MGYSHRLVGHGPAEEWSEFEPEKKVAYQGLPAGEYRFEVRARDMDGLVSEVAALEVQVVPTQGGGLEDPEDEPPASLQTEANLSPTVSGFLSGLGQVVNTDMTLLLAGETGTGKSLLAREIHALSPRRENPFVQINCGALPPGLVESELFGREQGMLSGAATGQIGCFERAHGGTLVLDAVSDLPLQAQGALLHILEDGRIRRVGGSDLVQVDVRVIAATNCDLVEAVREGAFRQDLYYRLSEFPVVLPPLRERREDIPVLAVHFAARSADELKRPVPNLGEDVVEHLQRHTWPGNVRELEHLIRRAVVLCEGNVIQVSDLPFSAEGPAFASPAEPEAPEGMDEKQQILEALKATNWIVYGDRGAARLLGMHPEKLRYRMSKYGLRRPKAG
ncbi:MAG: sigma 54-interacting transcriptional regulator [Gemmatimonadetes bacterium]|nr:sigma 54-interacting transcriptional regulator [Gemmatimonadota bacterium]